MSNDTIPSSPADSKAPAPARLASPLDRLVISPRRGTEPFLSAGHPCGPSLADFWSWAYSDLAANTTRGVLAEFLVASACGLAATPRTEWDACDLRTCSGRRIEVKSAAYLQSWTQTALSAVRFSIRPARAWDAATNTSSPISCRTADLYVFCLLAHQEKLTLDPLNLDQWKFYVLPTSLLNARRPTQQQIALSELLKEGARGIPYPELGQALEALPTEVEQWATLPPVSNLSESAPSRPSDPAGRFP